ncbi:hypothetical protein [Azospirillum sp. SYSU D00513]|uniref:hypothetical protein n=1 Tax=Azospirillum sp. SYSU D00513 TaxID=2812561 RepID=UPI001A97B926|nr:hypothetical protein [Azospirillum sp. SYSU D00513]
MRASLKLAGGLSALVMSLAGCVSDGGYNSPYGQGSGYGSRSSSYDDDDSPSVHNLGKRQREALKQGCARKYENDRKRYRDCIQGERHSEEALIEGCYQRYNGDSKKLRQCLGR